MKDITEPSIKDFNLIQALRTQKRFKILDVIQILNSEHYKTST